MEHLPAHGAALASVSGHPRTRAACARGGAALAVALLVLLAAPSAHAISCRQWDRMGPGQKSDTVYRMIDGTVSGSRGRQYHVDRGAVGRCLEASAQAIQYDFDGACADSRTAGRAALNRIFKHYIWSCAG